MTAEILSKAVPFISMQNVEKYLGALNDTFELYEINTPLRQAHFLAQVGHESQSFARMTENLNYSTDGLLKTFPKHFSSQADAALYNRNPVKIANRIYANRMGNGSEASGEGWNFRGRGILQLTGKENYTAYSQAAGIDLLAMPDMLSSPPHCILVAGWYFQVRNLLPICDADNAELLARKINGGTIGLPDRIQRTNIAKKILGV